MSSKICGGIPSQDPLAKPIGKPMGSRDDDWVTVEGVRYVPEAPLKAEIDRLQSQWTAMKDEVNLCHRWIHRLQAALDFFVEPGDQKRFYKLDAEVALWVMKTRELEAEIARLREWIVMADSRLEVADYPLCIDVARSYLKEALAREGE